MEEKTSNGFSEQQMRRRRINKMKMSILTGAGIWIIILSVLMVAMFVKLVFLENKLDRLEKSILSVEQVVEEQKEKAANSPHEEESESMSGNGAAGESAAQKNGQGENTSTEVEESRKVYLTFDDGPSENTSKILDILKERNIKATFFVVGFDDDASRELYQRIVAEGHTLGMHSYSHKYDMIYASLDAFKEDMSQLQSYLEEVTGVTPKIMRFPGGSSNQVSNVDMKDLIQYVKGEGLTYFDWNIESGDATSQAYTSDELVQNVMTEVVKYDTSVVLMHDTSAKAATVEALVPMIDQLQGIGAELLPIDDTTKLIQHIPVDSVE